MSEIQDIVAKASDEIKENVDMLGDKSKEWIESPKQGFVDRVLHKVVSRKLIVFTTATVLMWYGLDSETWGMIAMMYIGGQSAVDFARMWRHG